MDHEEVLDMLLRLLGDDPLGMGITRPVIEGSDHIEFQDMSGNTWSITPTVFGPDFDA